ncbi:MAG: T9SS type A sorting domain-containing protein [Bacteroidota bacterium]|nr:T9SS type A sorting domain-containing protein [Bacteroidota bacterium]
MGLLTSLGGTAPRAAVATLATAYPNPASDVLNVTLPAGTDAARATVHVFDLAGHEMQQIGYDGRGQVRVGSLPRGLYYITVSNGTDVTRQRFEKE